MNYLDLYSSYPDHTIAAAWDSQVKEADKNPWLSEALKQYGDELLRALPHVTPTCAPCLAAHGAAFSDELHAPGNWPRSCPNTFSRVGDDYSIRWLGRLPVPLYYWHSDEEWEQRLQSQLRRAILTSQPMASARS